MEGNIYFSLVDVLGQEIYNSQLNKLHQTIQLPNIESGIYQYIIQNEGQQISGKIVKGL